MNPTSWCASAAWRASTWLIASLMMFRPSGARRGNRLHRPRLVVACPRLVLLQRVHVEPPPHPRMAEAAELGAGDLVLPGLGDLEPDRDLVAGNRVLLQAEVGHEEAVDHVPGLELHA